MKCSKCGGWQYQDYNSHSGLTEKVCKMCGRREYVETVKLYPEYRSGKEFKRHKARKISSLQGIQKTLNATVTLLQEFKKLNVAEKAYNVKELCGLVSTSKTRLAHYLLKCDVPKEQVKIKYASTFYYNIKDIIDCLKEEIESLEDDKKIIILDQPKQP